MKNITINNRQKIIAVFPVIVFVLLIGLFSQASVAVTTVIVQEQWQNIEGISVVKVDELMIEEIVNILPTTPLLMTPVLI